MAGEFLGMGPDEVRRAIDEQLAAYDGIDVSQGFGNAIIHSAQISDGFGEGEYQATRISDGFGDDVTLQEKLAQDEYYNL